MAARRSPPPLSTEDFQSVGAFRLALRKFAAFSDASAREAGLTSQQHQALLAIRAHSGPEPMTIGELAECLLIKNHSAVELVGRLAERDLVVRAPSEADRRRILLRLTPPAEAMLEAITRRNLAELSSNGAIFRDLLRTLKRIGA
ncbi:MarR family winged helix-turn-helix transcriptional regulator [Phenylobacterium soli]|uniref:MarR family transcriptional regulator n=1 Tax=Phenylobacterium soli TaxID=2170551 RepID=A0A328AMF0_9CAUL|nr:MarR family transcriptional regulator [Phenylobacterium soli]RAK55749.1 MarR family transcriptional regulator [Phenylobacterium soli]